MPEFDVPGKLFPDLANVLAQLISTLVLFLVVKKYLWTHVQEYFRKRAEYMENQITEADSLNEAAKQNLSDSKMQLKEAEIEYRNIIDKAKVDAIQLQEKIVNEAKQEIKSKKEQLTKELEAVRLEMQEDIRKEIVEVAMLAASKIVEKELDTDTNLAIVEDFVKGITN